MSNTLYLSATRLMRGIIGNKDKISQTKGREHWPCQQEDKDGQRCRDERNPDQHGGRLSASVERGAEGSPVLEHVE